MSERVIHWRDMGARTHRGLQDLVGKPLFWVLFVAVALTWPIARTMRIQLPPPLPVLGQLPDFSLTSEQAQPFGSADLRGKIWVANFIFTRCPTVCPLFTAKMGKVQHRTRNLGTAFHLVSFSVDPEYDTPARLAEYAKSHRASPRMWTFLTGTSEAVKRTVVDGLKVSMGRNGPDENFLSIFHGTHFVLVDAQMRIRGYYDSSEERAIDNLVRDAGLLANRGS